jgi:dihydroorotase
MNSPNSLTIRRPDDWHVHLRDGIIMNAITAHTARYFQRAIIMPNLVPPVTTRASALQYRQRIMETLPADSNFTPLMTCYLTDDTDPQEIQLGFNEGIFTAVKFYPSGATTNSASGVSNVSKISGVLEVMQDLGMPLLVHGEVTDVDIDIFDREKIYIDRVLIPMLSDFPALKVVFEHITTSQAVDYVRSQGTRLGATITAHHLLIERNDMFKGGIRPHMYCLPVAKRHAHRQALLEAATSGDTSFFLGTDSAPHSVVEKESACGCAGIFSAPVAVELYAHAFDQFGSLDKLEAFSSLNGPAFYGLPANKETITLIRKDWVVPLSFQVDGEIEILPFMAGETLKWRVLP